MKIPGNYHHNHHNYHHNGRSIKIEKQQDSKYGASTGNERGEKMGLIVRNERSDNNPTLV